MTIRIKATHPRFQEINALQTLLCLAHNPHMAVASFDRIFVDLPAPETAVLIHDIEERLDGLFDEISPNPFAEFFADLGD